MTVHEQDARRAANPVDPTLLPRPYLGSVQLTFLGETVDPGIDLPCKHNARQPEPSQSGLVEPTLSARPAFPIFEKFASTRVSRGTSRVQYAPSAPRRGVSLKPFQGYWVDTTGHPGWHNMAVDHALLDLAEAENVGFWRLYRWDPHCLSFGAHEPASRRYDREAIDAKGIDCVRRPTGGRAVWHARELTYAVAAPIEGGTSLRATHAAIHETLATAVRSLGLRATLAADRAVPGVGAGPCFATPVGGEVVVDDRKVIGSAQRRGQRAFLQHGSVLLEDDQSLLRTLMTAELVGDGRKSVREPDDPGPSLKPVPTEPDNQETTLSAMLGEVISFERAAQAIVSILESRGIESAGSHWPRDLSARAKRHYDLYRSPEWTWRR